MVAGRVWYPGKWTIPRSFYSTRLNAIPLSSFRRNGTFSDKVSPPYIPLGMWTPCPGVALSENTAYVPKYSLSEAEIYSPSTHEALTFRGPWHSRFVARTARGAPLTGSLAASTMVLAVSTASTDYEHVFGGKFSLCAFGGFADRSFPSQENAAVAVLFFACCRNVPYWERLPCGRRGLHVVSRTEHLAAGTQPRAPAIHFKLQSGPCWPTFGRAVQQMASVSS